MTLVPITPGKGEIQRAGFAGPQDPALLLLRCVPGAMVREALEDLAVSCGQFQNSHEAATAITRLINSRLLLPRNEFLDRLRSEERTTPPPIGAFGILSNGRWNAVVRLVGALTSRQDFRDRHIPITICDDSGTLPPARATDLRIIGREERERYLETLISRPALSGMDRGALLFGLNGKPEWSCRAGANRNWWLLESAGQISTLMDDDEGPEYLSRSTYRAGIQASSAYHPLRLASLGQAAGLRSPGTESTETTPTDDSLLLDAFDGVIGQSASSLLAGMPHDSEVDLAACSGTLAHSLLRRNPSVLVAAAGVAGHPGWGSRRILWHLRDADRTAAVEDRRTFRELVSSPSVLWAAARTTVSHSPMFRAGCAAYDGTHILPPFPPVGRNEDGVFGLIIHLTSAPGSIVHVPIAVVHNRPETPENDPFSFVLSTNDYTNLILQDGAGEGSDCDDPAAALQRLGTHLVRCAEAPALHFRAFLADLSRGQAEAESHALSVLRDEYAGRPKWWAREVDARQAALWRSLDTEVVDVSDIAKEGLTARLDHLQDAVRAYGTLLQMWPTLHSVAAELRENGLQPSRPLTRTEPG